MHVEASPDPLNPLDPLKPSAATCISVSREQKELHRSFITCYGTVASCRVHVPDCLSKVPGILRHPYLSASLVL